MVSEPLKALQSNPMDPSVASKGENVILVSGSISTLESSRAKSKLFMKYNINAVFCTPMDKLDFTYWKSQFETVLGLHDLTQVVADEPLSITSSNGDENQEYEETFLNVCTTFEESVLVRRRNITLIPTVNRIENLLRQ